MTDCWPFFFSRRPRGLDDQFALCIYIYGEIRIYALGLVNGIEITVIYADRGDIENRIILAWRSEAHERRACWRKVEPKA